MLSNWSSSEVENPMELLLVGLNVAANAFRITNKNKFNR